MIEIIKAIPSWELLAQAAQIAEESGWHLYLVGGVVRDLLLAQTTAANLSITDIDLVVDGCQQTADVGAGVKLATALQRIYPAVHLDIHGVFQTAALVWDGDPEFGCLGVDIATARTEFYPYPAANPEVSPSSIRQDLYRRDFTINALAWRLTPATDPPLLDLFGGLQDLAAKQIRVLHPNSFIDDPTRIFRGVRFAVRLGFEFETQTAAYIRDAIRSGVYIQTSQAHRRTPALQTRLKTELKYLLQASYWQAAFKLLADLDAFGCIHSTLKLDRELLHQLRLLGRCLERFDRSQSIVHWQLRLELIVAYLDPIYRSTVATNLQLPPESINRLQKLDRAETDILSSLPDFTRVSQVVRVLRQFDRETLILIAVRCQNELLKIRDLNLNPKNLTVNCQLSTVNYLTIRRQIWKYLTVWQQIQPILNGNDLRQLGYQPGPQYREMLDNLLMATLDGDVIDRSSAEEFLRN